jgi:hypothetical protein
MKKLLVIICSILFISCDSAQRNDDEVRILEVLNHQEMAWNKGDIAGYMEGYHKSPELKFIGKNGLTKGWNETLERYKKSYPDQKAMGHLSFEVLVLEPINDEHYYMVGKWHLRRENDRPEGYFSLLWQNIDEKWVIISDHSS